MEYLFARDEFVGNIEEAYPYHKSFLLGKSHDGRLIRSIRLTCTSLHDIAIGGMLEPLFGHTDEDFDSPLFGLFGLNDDTERESHETLPRGKERLYLTIEIQALFFA